MSTQGMRINEAEYYRRRATPLISLICCLYLSRLVHAGREKNRGWNNSNRSRKKKRGWMSRQWCSSEKMSQRVSDGTEDNRHRLCCPFPPKVISSSLESTARLICTPKPVKPATFSSSMLFFLDREGRKGER